MSPLSPIALFASGTASSFGPCIAPRLVAIAGLAGARDGRRALRSIVAYSAGLVVAYSTFGALCALALSASAGSRAGYAVVAAVLLAMGLAELVGVSPWRGSSCTESRASEGASALLGAFSTVLVSPCCASAVVTVAAFAGSVPHAAILLASFGAGHVLPVVLMGACGSMALRWLRNERLHQALSAGSGTLLLGVAGYYAVLA